MFINKDEISISEIDDIYTKYDTSFCVANSYSSENVCKILGNCFNLSMGGTLPMNRKNRIEFIGKDDKLQAAIEFDRLIII